MSAESLLASSQRAIFLLGSYLAERGRGSLLSLLLEALISFMRAEPSRPNDLSRALPFLIPVTRG